MRHPRPLFATAVFLTVGCCAALSSAARAQSPSPREERTQPAEPPRLKNFDPRLRRGPGEKADAGGEKKGDDGAEEVIRVETTLVVTDVMVLDKQGRSIRGLTREDFVVREDGAAQQVGTFSLGSTATVPRSIVLVIDHSGSQYAYLKTSIEAAKTLVDKLGPRDRMAVVTDNVELLVDFTTDRALLKQTLDSLWERLRDGRGGRSEHYSALLATLNELFDEEDLRPVVIFQADGDGGPRQVHGRVGRLPRTARGRGRRLRARLRGSQQPLRHRLLPDQPRARRQAPQGLHRSARPPRVRRLGPQDLLRAGAVSLS